MTCQHIKSGSWCKICDTKPEKKKRKRIPAQSQKRKDVKNPEYREARDKFLQDNPNCELCKGSPVVCHHKKGRSKYFTDASYFMAVCSSCHTKIHANPKESFRNGWMILRTI